jgi:hypothetical protein
LCRVGGWVQRANWLALECKTNPYKKGKGWPT